MTSNRRSFLKSFARSITALAACLKLRPKAQAPLGAKLLSSEPIVFRDVNIDYLYATQLELRIKNLRGNVADIWDERDSSYFMVKNQITSR